MSLKPVAIIGISTGLPSGLTAEQDLDHHAFFDFLVKAGESYEKIPTDRFNVDNWKGRGPGQIMTNTGSFLKNIDMFDHAEFGITPKDARTMAVSTRKLVEHAFLALLDSGIDYRGKQVGSYMAGVNWDITNLGEPDEFDCQGSFAAGPSMIANKVSYHMDLLGPSLPSDTACSSTATLLHLAVQALRSGDCESAVVGGCQMNHRLFDWVNYSRGGILSKDGKCKPFDAGADGFGRGEGCVAIVVKLLEDAIRDGDHVYASVLGTGINSCGSAAPISAPVADAQADAMRRAYKGTGRLPTEVDFIELHATGTAAGDPTESNWVGANFKRDEELLIGSVKGNVGHLEITAFLASLSKVLSMLETKTIAPTVNFKTPNPAIHWDEYHLRVPVTSERLPARHSSGRALVSMTSSGIGGSNAHVVLEGPPIETSISVSYFTAPTLLVAGGLSPRSAGVVAEDIVKLCAKAGANIPALSTVYGRRSRQMTWRSYALVVPGQETNIKFASPTFTPRTKSPVVMVFSGQGPQHIEMGRQLFNTYPVFRESILEMDAVHERLAGFSIIERYGLFGTTSARQKLPESWPIALILPSVTMVQVALFDLLRSLGISADAVVGHSAGETSMLYASGAASRAMTAEIAVTRGLAMTLVEDQGTMAALSCTPEQAAEIIASVAPEGGLEIACYNALEAITLAGTEVLIDKAVATGEALGYFARKIRTRVPVHSSLMDGCGERYKELMDAVFARYPGPHVADTAVYSTLTGKRWKESFTSQYYWDNTRAPVKFTQAVTAILADSPDAVFIEVSAHPALASYLSTLGANTVFCPMKRTKIVKVYDESRVLLETVGKLAVAGLNFVDFKALNGGVGVNHAIASSLPAYSFVKRHVQYHSDNAKWVERQFKSHNGPLNRTGLRMNTFTHPNLAQHIINSVSIMPAAGYVEMALEFGARRLWGVDFRSMLALPEEKLVDVQVDVDGHHWAVKSQAATRTHAEGFMSFEPVSAADFSVKIDDVKARSRAFPLEGFYKTLEYFAQYGPVYRRITALYKGVDEALVCVRGADVDLPELADYIMHPAILDACLHVMVHPSFTANIDLNYYYLPSRIGSVTVYDPCVSKPFPETVYCHAVVTAWRPDGLTIEYTVTDHSGTVLCTMLDFEIEKHQTTTGTSAPTERFDLIYQPVANSLIARDLKLQPFGVEALSTDSVLDHIVKRTDTHLQAHRKAIAAVQASADAKAVVEADSALILSTVEHALEDFMVTFEHALDSISITDGKKAVRFLVLAAGRAKPLTERLTSVISARKDLAVELIYSDVSLGLMRTLPPASNKVVLDFDVPSDVITLGQFDLIVAFHALGFASELPQTLQWVGDLLVPGGVLLLGEFDGSAWAQSLPGTLWVDYIFAPHEQWPGLHAGKEHRKFPVSEWSTLLAHAKFTDPITPVSSTDGLTMCILTQRTLETVVQTTAAQTIIPFRVGHELDPEVTRAIRVASTLWFTGSIDIDGAAARGFTRSLRKELASSVVNLVLFDEVHDADTRTSIIGQLAQLASVDHEFVVDDHGQFLVPRVVPSAVPVKTLATESDAYWRVSDDAVITSIAPPALPQSHARLRVRYSTEPSGSLRGIVGEIVDAGTTAWSVGSLVISTTSDSLANYISIHEGQLAELPAGQAAENYAHVALGVAIAALAFGTFLTHPERIRNRSIVVVNDGAVAESLLPVLRSCGLTPSIIEGSLDQGDKALISKSDYILSPATTASDVQILRSFLRKDAELFLWNEEKQAQRIRANPWLVGDALCHVLDVLPSSTGRVSLAPHQLVDQAILSNLEVQLFDHGKAYILVGGIGSLGLQIAVWMYQKGARNLVLTSRSGRGTLEKTENTIGNRALSYLEAQSDLNIRLEASDASSTVAFKELVDSIAQPIGGCILLSVVLSDAMFASHTEDTYRVAFPPKIGALDALESAMPIEKMDFVISLSSFASLGSPGQTNYASVNSIVDERLSKYPNTFSLIAPAIIDSTVATGEDQLSFNPRLLHWMPWAMTTAEICEALGDGLAKLVTSPFTFYIPNIKWDRMQRYFGGSPMYDHLVKHVTVDDTVDTGESMEVVLQRIALEHLDVLEEDFDAEVPFTGYGLDSLSAGRFSFALRPYLAITQLQLLADLSLDDILERIRKLGSSGAQSYTTAGKPGAPQLTAMPSYM